MENRGFTLIEVLVVVAILAILLAGGIPAVMNSGRARAKETVIAKVIKMESRYDRDLERDVYYIYTDLEVFINKDDVWEKKYNSSDFYAQIVVDKTYIFLVKGYREPRWSRYRNILEFEEAELQ